MNAVQRLQQKCAPRSMDHSRLRLTFEKGAAFIVLGLSFIGFGYLVWALPRGYDVTDNGYYLLTAQHPGDVAASLTAAQIYLSLLLKIAGGGIVSFRAIGLGMLTLAALVLAWGYGIARSKMFGSGVAVHMRACEAALILQGVLLYYTWTLYTPSYNLLNVVLLSLGVGCALLGTSCPQKAGLAFAASGATCGAMFFVKFSVAPLFAGVIGAWIFAFFGRARAAAILWFIVGVAGWLTIHFVLLQDPSSWWKQWRLGFEYATLLLPSASIAGLLEQYARPLVALILRAVRDFWLPLALLLASALFLRVRSTEFERARRVLALVTILSMFALAVKGLRNEYHIGGVDYGRTVPNILLPLTMLLAVARFGFELIARAPQPEASGKAEAAKTWVLAILLLLLPLVGAFGTNVPFVMNAALYSVFWTMAVLVIAQSVSRSSRTHGITISAGILASLFMMSQLLTAGEFHPYRLAGPISEQRHELPFGSTKGSLLVDLQTKDFMLALKRAAKRAGVEPGTDLIVLSHMPGLVYALDARSPGGPWYTAGYKGSAKANAFLLRVADSDRIRSARVIVADEKAATALFATRGIDFPGAYELVEEVSSPFHFRRLSLWRPRR